MKFGIISLALDGAAILSFLLGVLAGQFDPGLSLLVTPILLVAALATASVGTRRDERKFLATFAIALTCACLLLTLANLWLVVWP